jgi:hypothetical protein
MGTGLPTPETIARLAAARLAADMDPGLPACVDRILRLSNGTVPDTLADPGTLGSFIVATAHLGCALPAVLSRNPLSARADLEAQLRRVMGIDEGVSADHDNVIEAVVAELAAGG